MNNTLCFLALDRLTAEQMMRELWAEYLAELAPRLRSITSSLDVPSVVREALEARYADALRGCAEIDVSRILDEVTDERRRNDHGR